MQMMLPEDRVGCQPTSLIVENAAGDANDAARRSCRLPTYKSNC